MTVLTATDATFDELVGNYQGAVLVDFTAAWCPPCRLMRPVVEAFAARRPDVRVVEVDVDACPAVQGRYPVRAMPSFVVFVNGEPVAQRTGRCDGSALEALFAA